MTPCPRLRLVAVGAAEHVERQRQVARAAGQRAGDGEIHRIARGPVPGTRLESRQADELERRLVAVHAAEVRGNPDRAAEVAADGQAAQAGGQRRGAASGRSTRRSRQVPRIVRGPVDRVIALPIAEHDGHVGFPDDDGACGFQTLDGDRRSRAVRILE